MPRFLLAAVLCAATLAACGDEPRATPTPTTAADGSTVDDLAPADRFDALLEVGLPLLGLDIDDVTAGEGATFDDHVLATCDQASAVAAAVDREFATVGGSRAVAADQRFVAEEWAARVAVFDDAPEGFAAAIEAYRSATVAYFAAIDDTLAAFDDDTALAELTLTEEDEAAVDDLAPAIDAAIADIESLVDGECGFLLE